MSTSESTSNKRHGLRRDLGLQIAIAVVVGNVIGSGIFLKPGNIARESGRFDLIIGVWVFGGLLCLLGSLSFAELATMLPQAGGLYVYLREAYGKLVGFLFGWTEVIFGKPASIGALSVAFIGSFVGALGWQPGPLIEVALASALIVGMAIVNVVGVVWGGRVQWATTVVKAGFLAVIALLPFVLIPWIETAVDFTNYRTSVTPANASLVGQVGAVLLAVMWAYNGWHGITPLAEEVQRPQRNIPLALFLGIGILMLLYVSANIAYHGVLSMAEMRDAGDHGAEQMLQKLLGPPGRAAMAAVIMCSTVGAINSNLLQAPRITFAMGRDRVFFESLGKVHATFRTPTPAILVMACMSILLVVAVSVGKHLVRDIDVAAYERSHRAVAAADTDAAFTAPKSGLLSMELPRRMVASLQDDSIFSLLTNFVIFSASIFYSLGVLAVVVLRWKLPNLERPYRTLGYPVTPFLFLAVYIWFLGQVYNTNQLESRVSLVLIAIGIPVFYLLQRRSGESA